MSLSAAAIDAMLEAGCSAEQIAAVVKAELAVEEAKKASKRAGNAERQQRYRDRRKSRKRNARNANNALPDVTPPIDRTHTPGSEILPDGKTQNSAGARNCGLKPEGVSDETWAAFEAARKARRAPITPPVVRKICEEADRARWRHEDAFAEISARGWQSFKAEWVQEKSNGTGNRTGGSTADTAQRVRERFGLAG